MTAQNGTSAESSDKRSAILEQAIRAFAEVGFRGADVQVIADRAGVGKGTVYRYFGNKEGLFWATTYAVLERVETDLAAAVEKESKAMGRLRALARAYARFFGENPHYLELFVQDRAEFRGAGPESHREYHQKLNERFSKIISEGVATGEIRPVDPRLSIAAFAATMYGCVVLNCYHEHNVAMQGVMDHAVEIFLSGLQPPVGAGDGEVESLSLADACKS